jgi:hypothetical protein
MLALHLCGLAGQYRLIGRPTARCVMTLLCYQLHGMMLSFLTQATNNQLCCIKHAFA